MSAAVNLIEQLQDDIAGRLREVAYFDDLHLVEMRLGTTLSEIEEQVAKLQTKNGKKPGAVILIYPPERIATGTGTIQQWTLRLVITVVELPRINRKTNGTGKWASSISLKLEDALHQWVVGNTTLLLTKVEPYVTGNADGEIGEDLTFEIRSGQRMTTRATAPAISQSGSTVTITGTGTIRYTTDGSYPDEANGTEYTAALTPAAGTLLRVVAYAGDMPSHVQHYTVT